jgi:hypothetical protein
MRLQLSALGARPMNTQQPAQFTSPNSNKSIVSNNTPALAQRQGISTPAYTDDFLRSTRINKPKLLTELSTRVESYVSILDTMIEHFSPPERTLDTTAIDGYLRKLRTRVPRTFGLHIDEEQRLNNAIFDLHRELEPMQLHDRWLRLTKLRSDYNQLLFDIKVKLNPD